MRRARRQPLRLANRTRRVVVSACLSLAVLLIAAPPTAWAAIVDFPDAKLEQVIRDAIDKPTGDINESDLVGLTELEARNKGILDLEGLQHCTDLVTLDLSQNPSLADIDQLAALTNLVTLNLQENSILDLSPLALLTDLETLDLESNGFNNVAALAGLVNLTYLNISTNNVSDIGPLALLTSLLELHAWENDIVSVAALAGMTNLTDLSLFENCITSITPLAGLTSLTLLALADNQIADISPLAALTNLTALTLNANPITDFSVLTGLVNLQLLYMEFVRLYDLSPLVLNAGLGAGDGIVIRYNHLCLSPGSEDQLDVDTLVARGVTVLSDPQLFCPDSAASFRVFWLGDVEIDGTLRAQAFESGAADIAEWVRICEPVAPGDVVAFDPIHPSAYHLSRDACSPLVAGVISTEPGVILGRAEAFDQQALLALAGIVPVNVTDEGGSIEPGDLLVSSSTPGRAMRWDESRSCPCALIGKALEPMTSEYGVILVLLTAH